MISEREYYCVCRAYGNSTTIVAQATVKASNAIEAITRAANGRRAAGEWTAYQEVAARMVASVEPPDRTYRVTADPLARDTRRR